jgi:hypothetical protein
MKGLKKLMKAQTIIKKLEKIEKETKTNLEKDCIMIILADSQHNCIDSWLDDLLSHGCISGMVGSLIYYDDTIPFFEKHKEEINKMIFNWEDETGCNFLDTLRGFDQADKLCLETTNQNLLTWFAFEETTRNLCDQIGLEY